MKVDQAVYNGYQQFCNFSVIYFFDTETIILRNVYTGWSGVIFALPIAFFSFGWFYTMCLFLFIFALYVYVVPYTTLEFRPLNSTTNGEDVTVILVFIILRVGPLWEIWGSATNQLGGPFPIIFIFSTLIYLNLFFSSSFCDPVKPGANCLLCPPLPS
jgi:hypothetical protein